MRIQEMNDEQAAYQLAQMKARFEALVREATLLGIVPTVEQKSLLPLAMGNYETVVSVRPGRIKARK